MGGGDKKLITICQAGGEFVNNKDGSLSYNNNDGDAHAIDIDSETKFDDFKLELAGMWNYSPETMIIKYILPGHGKTLITISNDKELKRMIHFHVNSTMADVFVITRDVIHHDVSNMDAIRSSRTTIAEAVVSVDDTPVECMIRNLVEPDPVPLESTSPNQPPAIAVTAASAANIQRAVESENTITGVDQRLTNVHEIGEALCKCSKKKLLGDEMEAEIQRSVALILMKYNDYVGARTKLLNARKSYPGLEYIDELTTVCDMICTSESQLQGSGIDWYSVLHTNKTANESDNEFKYTEIIRTLEPIKNKFPEIQSALGLIEKSYSVFSDREKCSEFDRRRAASLGPYGSVMTLDIAHSETVNINREATSQSFSGTKTIVSKSSDKSNLICNSLEQPLKRVRSLGGDDCEVIDETQSLNKLIRKVCGREVSLDTAKCKTRVNEVEGSLGKSSGSPVEAMVYKEPSLEFYDFSNHRKSDVFAVGQFLAVYDQEKMPRLYARIDRIESCYKKEINTLYVRWLRPAPINPDEKKWHEVGLPVSCGFFKLDSGKIDKFTIVVGSGPVFSHLVSPLQEYWYSKELFELYPREGEVWALYKEWKPFDWCSDPRRMKGCKFHLIEILNDYSTMSGVKVAFIAKVAGYKSIFRRSDLSFQIAARNLFGFSHNIPVMSAGDMSGLFSGMVLDLDPLSIPEDVVVDTVAAEFSNGSSKRAGNVYAQRRRL